MIDKIVAWLNAHPYVKGLLTALEGAASGAIIDAFSNPNAFTKAGLKQTLITVAGAMIVAMRNYFKTAPRKQWTPEERAAKTGGN